MEKGLTVKLSISALLLPIFYACVSCKRNGIDPEVYMNMEQRIKRHGYPVETYQIITNDDYILPLYHIPHGQRKSKHESKNNSAVLLVHGMGGSPQTFIILGAKRSMPYYLADREVDVWIFCSRGLEGSIRQKHRKYDWDKDGEYWLYSLHEISVYDLTATIDFVLNHTGHRKLSLVGHSAAGNEFACMFSEKPEYNEKITVAISWASSPILKRSDYPLVHFISTMITFWKGLFKYLKMTELFPIFQEFKPVIHSMCADAEWRKVCIIVTWLIGSHKSVLQRVEDIQLIASCLPRISTKQLFHFMDNFNNGSFRKYDYGPKKNMRLYGQATPPHYNLSATRVPSAFFFGAHDNIVQVEDIYESVAQIPNVVMVYEIPFAKFTHSDFIFARNATDLVYEPTYKLLKDIENGIVPPPIKIPSTNSL